MTLFVIVIIGFIIYLIIKSKLPKQTNRREPIYPTYLSDPKMRHPHRDKAVQEIKDWLEGIELTDVIVFDTETNGLYPEESSLLSIGAIRYSWDPYEKLKEKARFERCYYPKEPFNERAIMVNGLTKEKIAELRGDATYPEHFLDDYLSFKEFCEGSRLIAGHNVSLFALSAISKNDIIPKTALPPHAGQQAVKAAPPCEAGHNVRSFRSCYGR